MTLVQTRNIWTADELFAMTPNERHEVVQASIVTEVAEVPNDLLQQAQADIRSHVANIESAKPPTAP